MKEQLKPLAKIAISTDADSMLDRTMEQINGGNPGGRVTKAELASWLIIRASSQLTEMLIEEIRMEHFNQVTYLDNLLKAAKRSGRSTLTTEELERFQAITRRREQLKKRRGNREAKPAGEVS